MHDPNSAGLHLILDGYVADPSTFSRSSLEELFSHLAEALDMQVILGPNFVEVELDPKKLTGDAFQDEGGITGMCVISTSHMSIHCWPLRKCFSMDVFSCKDFDAGEALSVIRKKLGVVGLRVTRVDRRFPGQNDD